MARTKGHKVTCDIEGCGQRIDSRYLNMHKRMKHNIEDDTKTSSRSGGEDLSIHSTKTNGETNIGGDYRQGYREGWMDAMGLKGK